MGYTDYRNTPIGSAANGSSVPDSCCHTYAQGCGRGILADTDEEVQNKIFVNGCLEILKDKLENDVIPMMVIYAVVGVILALVELITVVLACAYVAQITRRTNKHGEIWRIGDATRNYSPDETDKPLNRTTDHETVC